MAGEPMGVSSGLVATTSFRPGRFVVAVVLLPAGLPGGGAAGS